MPQHNQFEVVGLGAPVVDHILMVSEEFVSALPGAKGGMEPVSYDALESIIKTSGLSPLQISGGSAANTVKGLANLGHSCALVGKLGPDPSGEWFLDRIRSLGITPKVVMSDGTHTAQVVCLITPDGQRTMRAFIGASAEIDPKELKREMFENTSIVHIEGYTLLKENLTVRAMTLAKEAGAKVSFDLASFEMTRNFKNELVDILKEFVDIIFANEDETTVIAHPEPQIGCEILMEMCETVAILQGIEGCWVGRDGIKTHCPAFASRPVDTTGAGDLFASGFLHGYLSGERIEECARYGSLTGAAAVHSLGAEVPAGTWSEIRSLLHSGF